MYRAITNLTTNITPQININRCSVNKQSTKMYQNYFHRPPGKKTLENFGNILSKTCNYKRLTRKHSTNQLCSTHFIVVKKLPLKNDFFIQILDTFSVYFVQNPTQCGSFCRVKPHTFQRCPARQPYNLATLNTMQVSSILANNPRHFKLQKRNQLQGSWCNSYALVKDLKPQEQPQRTLV